MVELFTELQAVPMVPAVCGGNGSYWECRLEGGELIVQLVAISTETEIHITCLSLDGSELAVLRMDPATQNAVAGLQAEVIAAVGNIDRGVRILTPTGQLLRDAEPASNLVEL